MKKVLVLSLATFFQGLSIGIIIPVMTYYVLDLGVDKFYAPTIFSVYSICSFISALFWGRISDNFGRKKVLIISALFTFISYIWLWQAEELWELFAARSLAGLFSGWMVATFAYVSDVTLSEKRTKGMGLIGAMFGMGFVIGPGIGGYISSVESYSFVGLVSGISILIGLIITAVFIKEPKKIVLEKKSKYKDLIFNKNIKFLFIVTFVTYCLFTMIEGIFALYVYEYFGLNAFDVGKILVVAGIFHVYVQGRIVGKLSNKIKEITIIKIGILVLSIGILLLVIMPIVGFYIPMTMISVGMALFLPALNSLSSKLVGDDIRGMMGGSLTGIQNLSRAIGPALGGLLLIMLKPYVLFIGMFIILMIVVYVVNRYWRKQFDYFRK